MLPVNVRSPSSEFVPSADRTLMRRKAVFPANHKHPMKNRILSFLLVTANLFLVTSTGQSAGDTYLEKGDASARFESAPVLPAGVSRITGTLKPGTTDLAGSDPVDVDLYLFSTTVPMGAWEIRVPSTPQMPNPSIYVMQDLRTGFVYHGQSSGHGTDAVVTLPGIQWTVAVAVANNRMFESPSMSQAGQTPSLEVATPVFPSSGQPYEILFDFKTQASGLNLSIGKKLGRPSQRGVYVQNDSGKDQTIPVSDRKKAQFRIRSQLFFWDTPVAYDIHVPSSLSLRRVSILQEDENVTAAFLTGRYRSSLTILNFESFTVNVSAPPAGPPTRFRSLDREPAFGRVLFRGFRADDRTRGDTVGALVKVGDQR
jgi:hypothetical protein